MPVVFVVLVFFLVQFGCSPTGDKIKISPLVRYQGNILYIKNTDSAIYDSVKVEINGSFKKVLPLSILPGEETQHELSSFLKDDGERFNVFKYGLVDISISCEASMEISKGKWKSLGKAFYYGKFS